LYSESDKAKNVYFIKKGCVKLLKKVDCEVPLEERIFFANTPSTLIKTITKQQDNELKRNKSKMVSIEVSRQATG
jgi:hypothetical protein